MLTHTFKLIWNKKKQNFLIMLELFFSFITMFAVFTLILNYYQSYQQPVGFNYTDVWTVNRDGGGTAGQPVLSRDSAIMLDNLIKQQVRSMRGVEDVTYTSTNTPYSSTRATVPLSYGNVTLRSDIFTVEDNYADLLKMTMQSGRWFSRDDNGANYTPAVINEKLKHDLFGNEEALNQLITFNERNYKVVGIVNNIKNESDYKDPALAFYVRADSNFYGNNNPMLVRVSPGADAKVEAALSKSLANLMRNTSVDIIHLDEKRITANKLSLLPVIIVSIVVLFFIINVALGLFGVLWHNINKRRGEIGLRRAIGASGNNISRQMVGEIMALTTLSIIAGSFFAIQFPLLNILDLAAGTYLAALALAIAFIYVFVILCALYPARQAAAIYPAVALHEG